MIFHFHRLHLYGIATGLLGVEMNFMEVFTFGHDGLQKAILAGIDTYLVLDFDVIDHVMEDGVTFVINVITFEGDFGLFLALDAQGAAAIF